MTQFLKRKKMKRNMHGFVLETKEKRKGKTD